MFHRDVLVVAKRIKMEFEGKKSIRFSAPSPSLLFWKESSLCMYELNTRWKTSSARNLKTSEHLQLAFATPKFLKKYIWFTLYLSLNSFDYVMALFSFKLVIFVFISANITIFKVYIEPPIIFIERRTTLIIHVTCYRCLLNVSLFWLQSPFIARPTGMFRRLISVAKGQILNFELITLNYALSSATLNILKTKWLLYSTFSLPPFYSIEKSVRASSKR